VVCGLGREGAAYVLADLTVGGERPEGWARRVAAAAEAWEAQLVVAEKNQGGDMVESVLRAAHFGLPVRLVSATAGKAARAEPIALHFEAGRARLAGRFPELEDQLCGLTYAGYEGRSPGPSRGYGCFEGGAGPFSHKAPDKSGRGAYIREAIVAN
jgi:phage terminase large subunit-like protein